MGLNLKENVPSPSREAWNAESSTKTQRQYAFGFVAAARFLGGQLFAAIQIKLMYYQVESQRNTVT